MGCDIHFFIEKKEENKWISADLWQQIPDDFSEIFHPNIITIDLSMEVPFEKRFYKIRNYMVFAKLANVRNSFGIVPLSEPRGLPNDCSLLVRMANASLDNHSHSWLTLQELIKEKWEKDPTNIFSGLEDFAPTIEKMKKLGNPQEIRCVFWFDS